MDPVSQRRALGAAPLAEAEVARFFVARGFEGLDCLRASFQTHVYAPHTHDTYAIGSIFSGCETFFTRGAHHYAGPGDFAFVNPHEVHDGAPVGGGYAYRMVYPTVALMRSIAEEISGEDAGTPFFAETIVRDEDLVRRFRAAFDACEAAPDSLAGQSLLFEALGLALSRHAGTRRRALGDESGPVRRVRALLDESFAETLALEDLSVVAGLSRAHLIRAFRRHVGLAPHAYLLDVRVRRAKDLLRRGGQPAEAAAACGFCDQSHLNRAFKARLGVTPGAYRQSALAA